MVDTHIGKSDEIIKKVDDKSNKSLVVLFCYLFKQELFQTKKDFDFSYILASEEIDEIIMKICLLSLDSFPPLISFYIPQLLKCWKTQIFSQKFSLQ